MCRSRNLNIWLSGEHLVKSYLNPSPLFICYLWKENCKDTNAFQSYDTFMKDSHDLLPHTDKFA